MHPQFAFFLFIAAVFLLAMVVKKVTGTAAFPFALAVLAEDRQIEEREGVIYAYEMAAGAKIYKGAIVCKNAGGYAVKGSAVNTLIPLGVAYEQVDNTAGGNGDLTIQVKEGVYKFDNSVGDPVTIADLGTTCYIEDDQTVSQTSGGGVQPAAGYVRALDDDGVWVEFKNTKAADGDLVAANNLSDVAAVATARDNLGFDVHEKQITSLRKVIAGGAAYLVTVADGDSVVTTSTDTAVISLPNAAAANKGLRVTVINTAADGAALISISPDASDKIVGTVAAVSLSGVADKDAQNTKATAKKGDYLVLVSDGVDSWLVVGGVGVWASQA